MSRAFAIVESGVVTNLILAESWDDGIDVTDLAPRPGPGWSFNGQAFAPPAPVVLDPVPPQTTPLMTHEAFSARMDFFNEFTPINWVRRTNPVVDAAFARFYGARNVDVRLPLTASLLGLLATTPRADDPNTMLLAAERIPVLLQPIPLTAPGAIDPRTGAITPEPFE